MDGYGGNNARSRIAADTAHVIDPGHRLTALVLAACNLGANSRDMYRQDTPPRPDPVSGAGVTSCTPAPQGHRPPCHPLRTVGQRPLSHPSEGWRGHRQARVTRSFATAPAGCSPGPGGMRRSLVALRRQS
jgi:hypothetical protein